MRQSNTLGWSRVWLAEYCLVLRGSGGIWGGHKVINKRMAMDMCMVLTAQHHATQKVSIGWRVRHSQARQCPCWISIPGSSCLVVGHWSLVSTSSVLKEHCRSSGFLLACAHGSKEGPRGQLQGCKEQTGCKELVGPLCREKENDSEWDGANPGTVRVPGIWHSPCHCTAPTPTENYSHAQGCVHNVLICISELHCY